MTARRLRGRGFEVLECANSEEFREVWSPGTIDVIVSDWDLAHDTDGDEILTAVRERDWDVPFVLVSGKLEEAKERAGVLETLLDNGGARFVKRGADTIREICEVAEDLVERRDQALVKVVLAL